MLKIKLGIEVILKVDVCDEIWGNLESANFPISEKKKKN